MGTDACFVYLYDEAQRHARAAGHSRRPLRRPRPPAADGARRGHHRRGGASMRPVMIAAQAHLDPRFMSFPNLPEDEYESILAVPVLARDKLAGALNVRTRAARVLDDEVALLSAIAGQVGQAIENAKLYERSQRRVVELEALADSRTMTASLYLDDVLRASPPARAGAGAQGARSCSKRRGLASASATARPARRPT